MLPRVVVVSGVIPKELSKLVQLQSLDLALNKLTGMVLPCAWMVLACGYTFPGRLPLPRLTSEMCIASVQGPIPTELGLLIRLEGLHLEKNQLLGQSCGV